MSFNHEQSRQLFGIGPFSGRGTKRAAESTASLSNPYGGIRNTGVWKKSKPTPINTISTMNDRRPKTVHNPYAAATSGGRNSKSFVESNPTASKTVTDSRAQKKRKLEPDRSSSKYWSEQGTRAVPSMVRPGINITQPDAGTSRRPGQKSARYNVTTLPSTNRRANSTEVISIDESESEIDKGAGKVVPFSLPVSDNEGEIDPSTQSPDEHPIVGPSRKLDATVKTRNRGNREISPNHPFKRSSPVLRITSDLSTQVRHDVQDGESTKSLKNRLRSPLQRAAIDLPNSPLSSPPPLEDTNTKDDEVEEIEDADIFCDTPRASSSKDRVEPQAVKCLNTRRLEPSMSEIEEGHIKQVTEELEEKRKIPEKFIADLNHYGSQKSRKSGSLLEAMKKRNPSTIASSRGKMPIKPNGLSSRDTRATAQTRYSSSHVVLPLDSWSWGTRKEEATDKRTPEYWLYWDDGGKELQVLKNPLGNLGTSKRKPVASLKLYLLKGSEITISDDDNFHIVRIQFNEQFDAAISDDVASEGLAFLFMTLHANIREWGEFYSRLKKFAKEHGNELRRVIGSGSRACFQSAMNSVDVSETRTQEQLDEAADVGASSTVALTMGNKEADASAQKKRQPRPRPAYAGRNQNIAEMFTEGSTRRSSRLLVEASKEDQEPPANLDEIILVYAPSGQGAINITSGDLRRLEPSEYLNDTLIELGLKLWLNELRTRQPELAESIHVFSSFFFKKLASKNNKTPEDGHKSVRKWTTKVDIFKKKYIIVPINENIHWYLAIIYHPEHILEPSLPKPLPRTSKRISNVASNKDSTETMIGTERRGSRSDIDPKDLATGSTTSKENDSEAEAQVEKELDDDVELSFRSCSLDELQTGLNISDDVLGEGDSKPIYQEEDEPFPYSYEVEDQNPAMDEKCFSGGNSSANSDVVADSLSEDSDDAEEVDQLDEDDVRPSHAEDINATIPPPSLSETSKASTIDAGDDLMDVDDVVVSFPVEPSDTSSLGVGERHMTEDEADSSSTMEKKQTEMIPTISADNFYARPNKRIKTYGHHQRSMGDAVSNQNDEGSEGDELNILAAHKTGRVSSEELEVTERPRTIIFSLDSLGSAHPKALSRLNDYLREEAKDKKGVLNPGSALTKKAAVPSQPNYCDCGLYLLHFAQTFMTDPQRYKEAIFADRKSAAAIDPRELWHHDQVGSMRESLKTRILEESESWKKHKAEKEKKSLDSKRAVGDGEAGQPPQLEESDDEIEVFEVRHVVSSPKKQTRKAPPTPAARLR